MKSLVNFTCCTKKFHNFHYTRIHTLKVASAWVSSGIYKCSSLSAEYKCTCCRHQPICFFARIMNCTSLKLMNVITRWAKFQAAKLSEFINLLKFISLLKLFNTWYSYWSLKKNAYLCLKDQTGIILIDSYAKKRASSKEY